MHTPASVLGLVPPEGMDWGSAAGDDAGWDSFAGAGAVLLHPVRIVDIAETGTQCLLVEQQRLLLAPYSLLQMILSLYLFFHYEPCERTRRH